MFVAPLRKALLEQVGSGLAVEGVKATDLGIAAGRKRQVLFSLNHYWILDQLFEKGSEKAVSDGDSKERALS